MLLAPLPTRPADVMSITVSPTASVLPVASGADTGERPLLLIYQRCFEALRQLVDKYAASHSLPLVAADRTYWVLTVPAIWDEAGKAFMRRAAHRAGEC
jgi:hypothetical protein